MFAWAKANKSKLKNPTPAQKKIFAAYAAMVKAGDKPANPKPRPTPKPAPKAQPKPKTKTDPKPADKTKPADKGGSGVHGQFRKPGDPGPNVTKPYGQLDRSGARVRRNQQDARRSRTNQRTKEYEGSNRRNDAAIKAEVDRNSGGSREAQRRKEARQRRARELAARRNRNDMRLRKSGLI